MKPNQYPLGRYIRHLLAPRLLRYGVQVAPPDRNSGFSDRPHHTPTRPLSSQVQMFPSRQTCMHVSNSWGPRCDNTSHHQPALRVYGERSILGEIGVCHKHWGPPTTITTIGQDNNDWPRLQTRFDRHIVTRTDWDNARYSSPLLVSRHKVCQNHGIDVGPI